MPILTLSFKDKKIRDYPIAVGQNCTIGRKKSNDIVIDNLAVSGNHATIDSVATTFVIRDMESTNGTFVNMQQVSMHNLRHGDKILIGKHELSFDRSDLMKKERDDAELENEDKTRILDTSEYRDLIQGKEQSPSSMPDQTQVAAGQESRSFFGRIFSRLFS